MATAKAYGLGVKAILNKEVDWDSDTIKGVLCSSSYTPNQDTHQYASSLTGELAGGGYARVTLSGKASTYTAGTNTLNLTCSDFSFTALTGTFRYLIIVDTQTGSDATSPLLTYVDFLSDQTYSGANADMDVDATNGLLAFTVA